MLNLVVDPKQPSRAKLPMVAGSVPGTKLSVGGGEDDTGVVGETPPDGPLVGKDCIGVFPEGATEPPGPEGTKVSPGTETVLLPEPGGVAIGVGTEPSPGVGTEPSPGVVDAPPPGVVDAPPTGASEAELGKPAPPLVAGRPGVELVGETRP